MTWHDAPSVSWEGMADRTDPGARCPARRRVCFSPPASHGAFAVCDVLQLRKVGWDGEKFFDLQVEDCQCAGSKPSPKNAQPPPQVMESRAESLPPAGED